MKKKKKRKVLFATNHIISKIYQQLQNPMEMYYKIEFQNWVKFYFSRISSVSLETPIVTTALKAAYTNVSGVTLWQPLDPKVQTQF